MTGDLVQYFSDTDAEAEEFLIFSSPDNTIFILSSYAACAKEEPK